MAVVMLSTSDNPFNPFTNFDDWYQWDERNGYHTTSYLGRIVRTSPYLSPQEQEDENERAINEILQYNLTGNYIKVEQP
ncbi:MAG: hypothetical protein LIR46_03495 [Bacteroidota bacterium]|nr:hypothetical protein [Bacteroidota bacterium]